MSVARVVFISLLAIFSAAACAQQPATSTYEPTVGQEGKDVVWVPTPQALVDKMLDMAKVTPNDFVMDLGSGDGRTVITVRPSPEPRSIRKSFGVSFAMSSILSTSACGVGTHTTSFPSWPTVGS